jgi:hypothetical protein
MTTKGLKTKKTGVYTVSRIQIMIRLLLRQFKYFRNTKTIPHWKRDLEQGLWEAGICTVNWIIYNKLPGLLCEFKFRTRCLGILITPDGQTYSDNGKQIFLRRAANKIYRHVSKIIDQVYIFEVKKILFKLMVKYMATEKTKEGMLRKWRTFKALSWLYTVRQEKFNKAGPHHSLILRYTTF